MKKLSLVMVFILLMTLIVSFNYLLWDRDSKMKEIANLESINAGKNVSINAQNSEIHKLEQDKAELLKRIEDINKEISLLKVDNMSLNNKIVSLERDIKSRNAVIYRLKGEADISLLAEPVNEWINALNSGNYEKAWNLEYEAKPVKDRQIGLDAYAKAMKEGVESIKLVSAELDKEAGKDEGLIYLKVKLEVNLAPGVSAPYFGYLEGTNEISVRIDYRPELERFIIAEIVTASMVN